VHKTAFSFESSPSCIRWAHRKLDLNRCAVDVVDGNGVIAWQGRAIRRTGSGDSDKSERWRATSKRDPYYGYVRHMPVYKWLGIGIHVLGAILLAAVGVVIAMRIS
jgi:hypothetical protein